MLVGLIMAHIILDVKEGNTECCSECPFWAGNYEEYGSNCGLPNDFPNCDDFNYGTLQVVQNESL